MRPQRLLPLLLVLIAPLGAAQESPVLAVERAGARFELRLAGGERLHQTPHEVVDARALSLPAGAGTLALWSELREGRAVPHYLLSLADGRRSRARETSYELHTRRGSFDPLREGLPYTAPQLGGTGELHIVQFLCPPLPEMLDELRALGAEVHHFLPQHARLVRAPGSSLAALAALSYVRWVGPYLPEYRLEAELLEPLVRQDPLPPQRVYVQVLEKGPAQKALVAERIVALGGAIEALHPSGYRLEATLTRDALAAVARMDEVLWIDRWSPPEVDLSRVRDVGGADALETATGYSGTGVRGEVMDGNVRQTHVAFQASPIVPHGNLVGDSDHGTKTTGCIFGDGAAESSGRGVLPQGQPIFADYGQVGDRYAHTAELLQPPYEAVFQSNSWGSSLTTEYTSTSMEMDDILFDFDLVIAQSQSNAGSQLSRPQAWAKNILSVGAVNHQNTTTLADDGWEGEASIGPAADGRVKPDLCFWFDSIQTTDDDSDTDYTTGFGGTSAATPCTAGFVGLVQQLWSEGQFGNGPSGASVFERRAKATTARALLINSARAYPFAGASADLTRTHTGWGLPDVDALFQRRDRTLVVDEEVVLRSLESASWQLEVAAGEPSLRATLVYLDLPGTTSASLHRVNDLSLRVVSPSGATYWGNNGLLAGNESSAGGSSNTLDVVENVFVSAPEPGVWTVEVHADELNADGHVETGELDADFALVVSGVEGPPACPDPTTYCTAKPTSAGTTPAIGWQNAPSRSANDFRLLLANGVPNQPAIVFSGAAPDSTPFLGGTRCVAPPVTRGAIVALDAFGDGQWPIDLSQTSVGDQRYYQLWFRDPADPTGFGVGLSDGLAVTVCD